MPASFRIDPVDHLIHSRAWGALTDDDIVSNRAEMIRHPDFRSDGSQIYDFTEVTDVHVTVAGIRELAQRSAFSPTARRAIVVATDVAYGMARMYALLSNRSEEHFRIFRDAGKALAWLHHEDQRRAVPGTGPASSPPTPAS